MHTVRLSWIVAHLSRVDPGKKVKVYTDTENLKKRTFILWQKIFLLLVYAFI